MFYDPSFLLLNKLLLSAVDLSVVGLIFWVYFANPKAKLNQSFCLMALSFLFWLNGGYFFSFSNSLEFSLWLGKVILGEVSISFSILYFFITIFPYKTKRIKILDISIVFLATFFCFFPILTNLVVKDVRYTKIGINPIFGEGQLFYYGWLAFLMISIFVQIFRQYLNVSKNMRIRIQYFFVGFLIFIFMHLVFNVFFPLLKESIKYWQFGNYSTIFLLAFVAYAIVKQNIFGIKVILTQVLIGVIAILLLAQAIMVIPNWFEFSWRFGLFLIFVYFGYLLIKSVLTEIQRRTELQRLYEEVDRLSRAKSEFISIASHQLRTPLTAVKGYISMIIEGTYGKLPEKLTKPLENVYQSNERLIKLVNDLLNLSRLEAGKLEFKPEPTSLEKIISAVIEELKITATKKGLYLKIIKSPESLPKIMVDRDKLRQVILNIIDNAIKYTKNGGVTIELRRLNSKEQIRISDTGEGMTKNEVKSLFQMFSRATAGTQLHTEGAGIGLYVAKKFIEMHGGKIWAESQGKGKGSTFYIELPLSL